MRPSGAQWGISKFFVSNHSDAPYFFFKFVSRINNSSTKHVSTSLNKREGSPLPLCCITYNACSLLVHSVFFCYKPLLTQTKHYVFFQIYSPANISNIYRPSQFEKVHSERFQSFFLQTSTDADLSCQGCQKIRKFWKNTKGQIFSKCLIGAFTFSQKTNENKSSSSKDELFRSFFGRK